mmetsp:Transcript_28953/g.87654  ORF Transcript_28953/g.87654 Transcript_28953/m.87654 type:complete len:214 (+) Transcript_28953:849-1490(+)
MMNMQCSPWLGSPTRWPVAPPVASPNSSSPALTLAVCPILWLSPPSRTSLRSPSETPSSLNESACFGTRKREMPLVPAGAPGSLASTMCTMVPPKLFSAAVIHILFPRILYVPSGCGCAVVRMSVSDEPACVSERHMVPHQSPLSSFGSTCARCSSVPWCCRIFAAPTLSAKCAEKPAFADEKCSPTAPLTATGICDPPTSASIDVVRKPASE